MECLNILVVEDETPLAEMHAEFIKQSSHCHEVWLAGNLQQARSMVARFHPDLILLDNYLPDGSGLELLRELTLQGFSGGIFLSPQPATAKLSPKLSVMGFLIIS